jgi:hypothetical protein
VLDISTFNASFIHKAVSSRVQLLQVLPATVDRLSVACMHMLLICAGSAMAREKIGEFQVSIKSLPLLASL